jgi:hypothetical protein
VKGSGGLEQQATKSHERCLSSWELGRGDGPLAYVSCIEGLGGGRIW